MNKIQLKLSILGHPSTTNQRNFAVCNIPLDMDWAVAIPRSISFAPLWWEKTRLTVQDDWHKRKFGTDCSGGVGLSC